MMKLKRNRVFTIFICLIFLLLFPNYVEGLSISPTELKIQNVESKDYTFIVLITNDMEGLVDVELKSSYDGLVMSPNKFMLNAGEKRSIRVLLNTRKLEEGVEIITVQPFANSVPSSDKLKILLNSDVDKTNDTENKGILTTIKEPEIITIIIYTLLALTGLMIIAIFIPEIKKNIKKINNKSIEIGDKKFYSKMNKKSNELLTRLDSAEKRINNIIEKVEQFHSTADKWLRDNTGGSYGLE